jgi:hypothetical protein
VLMLARHGPGPEETEISRFVEDGEHGVPIAHREGSPGWIRPGAAPRVGVGPRPLKRW